MSSSSRSVVLVGAIIAAGLCLFLAFQAAALLLPFVLSGSYRWVAGPLFILMIALGAILRARKRRKGSLSSR